MKKLSLKTPFIAILSLVFVLTSCNTSLEVVKRKYRKGYHVSLSNNQNQKSQAVETSHKNANAKSSIQFAAIDSPAVDTSKVEELFPLKYKSDIATSGSPNLGTTKQVNFKPSNNPLKFAQKIK